MNNLSPHMTVLKGMLLRLQMSTLLYQTSVHWLYFSGECGVEQLVLNSQYYPAQNDNMLVINNLDKLVGNRWDCFTIIRVKAEDVQYVLYLVVNPSKPHVLDYKITLSRILVDNYMVIKKLHIPGVVPVQFMTVKIEELTSVESFLDVINNGKWKC